MFGIAGRGDSSLIRPVPDAETLLNRILSFYALKRHELFDVGTKGIFMFYILGVYVIKLSVSNEIICVFNKHHVILRRYSDHPWNIVCSVGMGLGKHGYGKKPPTKAYFGSSEYFI